jgi:two-component system, chemotaxis family, response regulator Rcp1
VINGPTAGRPLEVLLVEDNPGDVRLTVEGLK